MIRHIRPFIAQVDASTRYSPIAQPGLVVFFVKVEINAGARKTEIGRPYPGGAFRIARKNGNGRRAGRDRVGIIRSSIFTRGLTSDPVNIGQRAVGIECERRLPARPDLFEIFFVKFLAERPIGRDGHSAAGQRAIDHEIFESRFSDQFFDAGALLASGSILFRSNRRRPTVTRAITALRKPDPARPFTEMTLVRLYGTPQLTANIIVLE